METIINKKLHKGDKLLFGLNDIDLQNELLQIEVKMIYNGIETDSFFLHY